RAFRWPSHHGSPRTARPRPASRGRSRSRSTRATAAGRSRRRGSRPKATCPASTRRRSTGWPRTPRTIARTRRRSQATSTWLLRRHSKRAESDRDFWTSGSFERLVLARPAVRAQNGERPGRDLRQVRPRLARRGGKHERQDLARLALRIRTPEGVALLGAH